MEKKLATCYQITAEKEFTYKAIHTDMIAILGANIQALSTMQKWIAEFRSGRESVENCLRSGCSATVTNEENINLVPYMVMETTRVITNQTANAVNISCERTVRFS